MPRRRTAAALAAATVLNLPFGTLYAFSVFLKPMEALLAVGRAEMSFVFGLATITLTVGMNVAPALYRAVAPGPLALACGIVSAGGLLLAATAGSFVQFALADAGGAVGVGLDEAGAGVPVQAVNQLLNQFEQMQKMMKMMKGGNLQRMMRNLKGVLPGMR